MFDSIHKLVDHTHPWVGGAIMAIAVSTIRIVYDKKETSLFRIVLESLICGALSVSAGSAFEAMGYGQNWYLFCGGFIGFMGSQSIRALANKYISNR